MIITKCPLRVSLFGGSTDNPYFIEKYGEEEGKIFYENLIKKRTYKKTAKFDLAVFLLSVFLFWQTIMLERRLFRNSISITPQ